MVDSQTKKNELRNALMSQDPNAVARAVDLPPIANEASTKEPREHQSESFTVNDVDCSALLVSLLDATNAAEAGYATSCFEAQKRLHAAFNRVFGSSEGNWLVPALHVVCRNTHNTSIAADREVSKKRGRQSKEKLESAVQLLQDSYSKTFNDRTDHQPGAPFDAQGSKKAGVLYIVNQLFSMYFRLNILRLCKNLIKPVETRKLNENAAMGQMVTYKYYIGRVNMFEDNHEQAEMCLDYAFQHCHQNAIGNKRRILRYLVPLKLYRGRLPTDLLLEKYSLSEFKPLVEGIRKGDLRTFQDGLVENQHIFIRQGTYLLLEKCKTVCYRNLFKRIYKILDKHQVSLTYVARAFKWLGTPIDMDEIECVLANLIYRGYIRGYLSHSKRVLVLSKKDPFPTSYVIK